METGHCPGQCNEVYFFVNPFTANLVILMWGIKLSLFLVTFQGTMPHCIYTVSTHASSKPFWDVCDSWIRDVDVDLEPYMYISWT